MRLIRLNRVGPLAGLGSPIALFAIGVPVVGSLFVAAPALAQVAVANADEWSRSIWAAARNGSQDEVFTLLNQRPELDADRVGWLSTSVDSLTANLARREEIRAEELKRVNEELDKQLAAGNDDLTLARALKSAVELHYLTPEGLKASVLADERIVGLRRRAESGAHAAEARADWFTSSELFARLDTLYEDTREYHEDLRRQGTRLAMIRLYAPERFWDLRNQRRLAEEEKPLPPYNPMGDSWDEKLTGISRPMVVRAVERAAVEHVDREASGMSSMLIGGLEAVRTMLTTEDLAGAFPGLRNPDARSRMIAALAQEEARLRVGFTRAGEADSLLRRLMEENRRTVNVADTALMHEFGNGAMGELDEFSSIIWPDEVRRFNKNTQGNFIGVGIQIQLDELSNIRVVTPLEGTPAQRAGVRAGDIIKKVNGRSTLGFTLDQAVDVITGPSDTPVTLTLEREVEGQTAEIDMRLVRERIEVASVKGWKRLGAAEDLWDWFIDHDHQIGYVRLLNFTEKTDQELDAAIRQMRDHGLNGLILDLRFNPGGLLEQAVAVASRFVDPPENDQWGGIIVSTHGPNDAASQREYALTSRASLAGVPVVVLVNEGSASASEIVSGAIQDYARRGVIRGVVVGARSFGKGSVQNVWQLPGTGVMAAVKLTTQYYKLPGGRLIHRKAGAAEWGVEPNMKVEMLPKQIAEAFTLRQNADVLTLDERGVARDQKEPPPNPDDLITKGLDLQLQQALVLLQTQTVALGEQHEKRAQIEVPVQTRKNN